MTKRRGKRRKGENKTVIKSGIGRHGRVMDEVSSKDAETHSTTSS